MSRSVLYVDDEPDNLFVFEAGFEDDFDVHTAGSGAEALALIERRPFPVVVADQRMPGMTGVQLFEILRERSPWTKRILLTGYSDPESMIDAINKGHVFHYVNKPWERHELFAVLVRAFETYELERANSRLTDRLVTEDRCATLGRMTARITHEMGNQLCLLPLVETIEANYTDDEELLSFAQLARQVLQRLTGLVEEVKRFTRLEQEEFVPSPVPLSAAVHELIAFLRFDDAVPVDRIDVRVEGEPVVSGHQFKIQQVLLNLLHNAVHAIAGREDGRVAIEVEPAGNEVVIAVRDNGPGVPPDLLDRIWEPFFTTKGERGNGIGLDVSRRIVEAHGGRIACESDPDRGSTFTIHLPRHRTEETSSPIAAPAKATSEPPVASHRGVRVG